MTPIVICLLLSTVVAQDQPEVPIPVFDFEQFREVEPITVLPPEEVVRKFNEWADSGEHNERPELPPTHWAAEKPIDELLIDAFVLTDKRAAELISAIKADVPTKVLELSRDIQTNGATPLYVTNLCFEGARYLTRNKQYDEALEIYASLEIESTTQPAAFLFFRAISEFGLLRKDEAIDSLTRIVDDVQGGPERYRAVAEILLLDLQYLDEEGLDHLARTMDDIKRRLDLGRVNERVRDTQAEVIARLDRLIEKIENPGGGGGGGGGGGKNGSGGQPSGDGMKESKIARLKGSGAVDNKKLKGDSAWGNLPEKERARMLQALGRDFPDHYKNAIQEYFRKLATESDGQP